VSLERRTNDENVHVCWNKYSIRCTRSLYDCLKEKKRI